MHSVKAPQELLAQARVRFSQRALAELLGKDVRTVSRWENGETPIKRDTALAIQSILRQGHPPQDSQREFTFIDLFAGIGGLRKGFQDQGGKCVFTSEWDSYAEKTYRVNFPEDVFENHIFNKDITECDAEDIPSHDVLLAGFPCQPFSIAGVSKKNALGRPHGFECKTQGTLFFDAARIISHHRPVAFLLENVKNLRSHDRGRTFQTIIDVLENELKYDVHVRVINGKGFVPQNRERIYIVGFRKKRPFSWDEICFPELDEKNMASILHLQNGSEAPESDGRFIGGVKGKVLDKYTLSDKLWAYLQSYADKHRAQGNGFGFGLVGKNDIARTLSARYYKDGSEILVSQGRGNPRRLTPRECARLMGFDPPESVNNPELRFKIPVSDTRAYKQFGNSVVVPVIREIARVMKPHIMDLKQQEVAASGKEEGVYAEMTA